MSSAFPCRACGSWSEVKDSRPRGDGNSIRRRRMCASCKARFTTVEVRISDEPIILTSDGAVTAYGDLKTLGSRFLANNANLRAAKAAATIVEALGQMRPADMAILEEIARRFSDAAALHAEPDEVAA